MTRKVKQRGNGQGTVITLKRDGRVRYAAEITLGWEQGLRKKKRGELRTTKATAQADLETLKRQHARDVDVTDTSTVADLLSSYLTDVIAPHHKVSTLATYRWAEKHLVKAFGDVRARKLQRRTVQRYFSGLVATLKPKSISLIYTVFDGALKEAMRNRLIDGNPADDIKLPSTKKRPAMFLTPEQARAFLAAARGERLELGLRIMLSLGLRRGEVAGLRWDDLNLTKGTLHVAGSLRFVSGHGLVYTTPKTDSSERVLRLPASLQEALRQHQARLQVERRAMGDKWQPDCPYVFVASSNGGPLNSGDLYRAVKRTAQRAGLPATISPHSLRHSCASFLYAEGVPEKAISAFLGHANTTITRNLYVHLLGGELDTAAEQIERLLDSPVPASAVLSENTL